MTRKKLLLGVLVPLIAALPLLEIVLRASGYGYDSTYWLSNHTAGTWEANPLYYRNWLPPASVVYPSTSTVTREKPADTKRVLLVGSSALQGHHEARFNLTRQLTGILGETQFEVVEASLPGIDSAAIEQMVRDSMKIKPDLCIVFAGHQEFFQPERDDGWHTPWRVKQLLNQIARWGHTGPSWRGPATFADQKTPIKSFAEDQVYERFTERLKAIQSSCDKAGVALYLCTLPTNIKVYPPFESGNSKPLSKEKKVQQQQQLQHARRLAISGKLQAAVTQLGQVLQIDDGYAEAHHLLASILTLDRREGLARAHYQRALDLDRLRQRADSQINERIKESGAQVIDLASAIPLQRADLFHDHVHLNFAGHHRAAMEMAKVLAGELPASLTLGTASNVLARTPKVAAQIKTAFLREQLKPPFTLGWNYQQRFQQNKSLLVESAPRSTPSEEELHQRRLSNPYDLQAHRAATFDTPEAGVTAMKKIARRLKDSPEAQTALADAYVKAKDLTEARRLFLEAKEMDPYYKEACLGLARLRLQQSRHQSALDELTDLIQTEPDDPDLNFLIGLIFLDAKHHTQAGPYLQRAIEIEPQNPRIQAALQQATRAIDDLPRRINNEGTNFLMAQKYAEALAKYREAVELAPDALPALNNLAYLLATAPDDRVRNGKEAVEVAQRIINKNPDLAQPGYRATLAAAFAESGDFDSAVETLIQAIEEAEQFNLESDRAKFHQILDQYKEGQAYRHKPNPPPSPPDG